MKLKKSVFCILLAIILLILIAPKTMAANLTISFSSSQAKAGDTVTATVVGNGIIGKVDLSVSGNATLSQNSIFVDGSASVSVKINGEGDVKITATAVDMAYSATGEAFPNETDKGKKSTAGTIKVASSSTSNNGASNNGSSSNSSNGSSSSNTSNGNSSGNSTQRPSTSTETKKSSNANLKDLGIKPNDFKGFKSGTTAYNVTVPNDVEQVKVYATAQDSKSKITGTGNKKLTVGKNKLDVVVTAEDGTTKTYTINVTREEAAVVTNETTDDNSSTETQENTQNNTTEDNTDLKNLTISGYTLTPSFSPNVYEYKLDVKGDISSLDIQTEGANHSVSTDIAGNENLKDGENIITIHVYNEETKKNSTYQIIVNKMTASSEDLNVTLNNAIKKANKIRYIFFGTVLFIVIASIVFIIVRHNIKKDDDEDKEDDERLNLDDEDELFSRVNKDEKKGKHF